MSEEQRAKCYVVVAEWDNQGPIVLEAEGDTSLAAAYDRAHKISQSRRMVRYCICELTVHSGNPLVLMDLARFQPQAERCERRTYPVSGDEEVKF